MRVHAATHMYERVQRTGRGQKAGADGGVRGNVFICFPGMGCGAGGRTIVPLPTLELNL